MPHKNLTKFQINTLLLNCNFSKSSFKPSPLGGGAFSVLETPEGDYWRKELVEKDTNVCVGVQSFKS